MRTNWSLPLEHHAVEIGEQAGQYKVLHLEAAKYSERKYNSLMLSAMILGPLSGLVAGIGVTLYSNSPTPYEIVSTCIACLSGIVVTIVKFGNYEQKTAAHQSSASQYTRLESSIRRELDLPSIRRMDPVKFLQLIDNSFDELFTTNPLLVSSPIVLHHPCEVIPEIDVPAVKSEIDVPTIPELDIVLSEIDIHQSSSGNTFSSPKMDYELRRWTSTAPGSIN